MPKQSPKKITRRPLGQHFLRSSAAVNAAVDAAHIAPGESVLEIGPGEGVLTRALLAAGAKVIAVEKDARLAASLLGRFENHVEKKELVIVRDDILTFDARAYGLMPRAYKLVANIPYYITGAILEYFLSHEHQPSAMVLMVQKEVAERIIARNGKPLDSARGKESILSVSVKAYGAPRFIKKVPRGSFTPPPSVDSALIAIENISKKRFEENDVSEETFFEMLRKGFAHKRKLLVRNLGVEESVLTTCGVPAKARAEDISLAQWFCLARATQNR